MADVVQLIGAMLWDGDNESCAMCADAAATRCVGGEGWCDDCLAREALSALTAADKALRLALPVMRRTSYEYLDCHAVAGDITSISRMDWAEVEDDIAAIVAAEAAVGAQTDIEDVDTEWMNRAIARFAALNGDER